MTAWVPELESDQARRFGGSARLLGSAGPVRLVPAPVVVFGVGRRADVRVRWDQREVADVQAGLFG